jgi:thymidylate synthase
MKYTHEDGTPFSKKEFLEKLKTDKEFNDKFGNKGIDQITELIRTLKDNPDSRRLLVSAWNASDLRDQVLPPCHYGFQVYTRELSLEERENLMDKIYGLTKETRIVPWNILDINKANIPTRAISLMWNQRSCDLFLGIPFNIASYGLLLEILAKEVNMIPDELIGNLGDVHLYSNHIEQAKEQIGRDHTCDERINIASTDVNFDPFDFGVGIEASDESIHKVCDLYNVSKRTREPFPLPTLEIKAAIGLYDFFEYLHVADISDFEIKNYQSHPTIKAPLSN